MADPEVRALALAAAEVLAPTSPASTSCEREGARILEVNSMPAWRGLQPVTSTNIAGVIARELVASLETQGRREAAI